MRIGTHVEYETGIGAWGFGHVIAVDAETGSRKATAINRGNRSFDLIRSRRQ